MTPITQEALAAALDRHSLPRLTSLEASDPARAIGFAGGTVWRCSCGDWEFRVLPATGGLNNERPYGAFNRHVAAAIFAALPAAPALDVERLFGSPCRGWRTTISPIPAASHAMPLPQPHSAPTTPTKGAG